MPTPISATPRTCAVLGEMERYSHRASAPSTKTVPSGTASSTGEKAPNCVPSMTLMIGPGNCMMSRWQSRSAPVSGEVRGRVGCLVKGNIP